MNSMKDSIKLRLTRLFLINKRLFRTYSFIVLLLMIPLTAGALSLVSTQDKGIVTISVCTAYSTGDAGASSENDASGASSENGASEAYSENGASGASSENGASGASSENGASEKTEIPGVHNVLDRLKKQSAVIRFLESSSAEEAKETVLRGKADAAWIFAPDYEERVREIASGTPRVLVDIYTKEDTVFMRLAREKLFAALYPDLSAQIFREFIRRTAGEIPEEDFEYYYNMQAAEGSLVRFALADSPDPSGDEIEGDYLLFPVRGLLSILIFAAGMAGAIFYARDEKNSCFVWLPQKMRHGMLLSYIGSAVFWTSLASYLAMLFTGTARLTIRELVLLFLYGTAVTALCSILRRILRDAGTLAVFLPVSVLLVLGLCPVFLNFKTFRVLSRLLPAFHYLHAVNSAFYARSLLITALLYAAADLAAALLIRALAGRK